MSIFRLAAIWYKKYVGYLVSIILSRGLLDQQAAVTALWLKCGILRVTAVEPRLLSEEKIDDGRRFGFCIGFIGPLVKALRGGVFIKFSCTGVIKRVGSPPGAWEISQQDMF